MPIFTRRWIFLLFFAFSVKTINAQGGDVIITGKIENPVSQSVSIHYKKNLFSMEEGYFETKLDNNNVFSVRVKIPEPRAIYLNYNNTRLKLYLVPNDSLKLAFKANDILSTVKFEGSAALPNKYLAQLTKKFPDIVDERIVQNERAKKSPREYQTYIDNLYFGKRRFYENYLSEEKDYFNGDFQEYAANDNNYWRAYQLMMYYKQYGLNNKDNTRFIDDNYFNFLFNTENVYSKALNNDYYLQFLELYLTYIREKDVDKYGKANLDAVEERSRQVQTVKPTYSSVYLLEDPVLSKKLLINLGLNDELEYLNLTTESEFEFVSETVTYNDKFLQVQTKDGLKGWVPQRMVTMKDKNSTETTTYARQCLIPTDPMCGFKGILHGKVMYYFLLKDIMYSYLRMPYPDMQKRLNDYTNINTNFPEYNKILKEAYETTLKNRERGDRMYIPQSCFVEDMITKQNINVKPQIVDIVPEKTTVEPDIPQPVLAETPKKPDAPRPSVETAIKHETPNTPTETTVVNTPTGVNITVSPKAVVDEKANKIGEKTTDLPVENTVKSVEKSAKLAAKKEPKTAEKKEPTKESAPPIKPETSKNKVAETNTAAPASMPTGSFNFVQGEKKVELNTQQEIVPWTGMLDYKPDGKPVIFNGLVINDNIPIFTMVDVNGKEVKQQELLGKILVIDFWASWCGPCQMQLQHSKVLAEKYKDKDVVFVFISVDSDAEAWKTALREKNLPGLQANDKVIIPLNFLIQGVPNIFIVDAKGKIAYNSMLKSPITIDKMIESLLRTP
jgi:thiol-disulfide isomerase/thioredoxin